MIWNRGFLPVFLLRSNRYIFFIKRLTEPELNPPTCWSLDISRENPYFVTLCNVCRTSCCNQTHVNFRLQKETRWQLFYVVFLLKKKTFEGDYSQHNVPNQFKDGPFFLGFYWEYKAFLRKELTNGLSFLTSISDFFKV